ncbi:uncharacterized protein HD556DRAFT_1444266 [Suillus plorans]|uniref:DUF6532 domain-containing protein n=1 Tax=Suillus plorans TaxID=116603 RepID=A0A9P7APB2_9AGAM|nr:uncharacterized protein HD556DRAFT_1444266 [Suillus plorans]KAG1792579.1 hypothetical protein HD556DRAFT_1444266 [Suillus plorans]
MFSSVAMQRTGSEKLLCQPICRRGRERNGHALLSCLEEPLLFKRFIDAHLHFTHVPLVQSLHVDNHLSKTDMYALHPHIRSLLFSAHLDQSLRQVVVIHSPHLIGALHHALHLTILYLHTVKTNQEDPSKLGFYPPTWQTFLQMAKLEMQLQAVIATPVPESQEALNLPREVLDTVLWTYHEKKIKLERGYFLEYTMQMCWLLCNDLFTFHTELKKIVISIAKRAYNIFPQGSTMRKEECQRQVTAATTRLLKSGDYLRLPDSSGGNFKNFTVQALKDACLEFYYSNTAVLKGVISGFHETGTDKVPELTAEQCRTHFVNLRKKNTFWFRTKWHPD